MSHSEDYRFSQYEPFQKRVAAALSRAATNITSESDATENYAARQRWVGAIHRGRYSISGASLAIAVQLDGTITGKDDSTANADITDAAIDTAVGGLINTLSR